MHTNKYANVHTYALIARNCITLRLHSRTTFVAKLGMRKQ